MIELSIDQQQKHAQLITPGRLTKLTPRRNGFTRPGHDGGGTKNPQQNILTPGAGFAACTNEREKTHEPQEASTTSLLVAAAAACTE